MQLIGYLTSIFKTIPRIANKFLSLLTIPRDSLEGIGNKCFLQPFDKDFRPFNHDDETFDKYFSSAGFTLSLSRVPTPFIINTFLPTGLLTLISFIGFVIPVEMVPGRMALLVTIFLMLVNISAMEGYRGPVVRTSNPLLMCLPVVVFA